MAWRSGRWRVGSRRRDVREDSVDDSRLPAVRAAHVSAGALAGGLSPLCVAEVRVQDRRTGQGHRVGDDEPLAPTRRLRSGEHQHPAGLVADSADDHLEESGVGFVDDRRCPLCLGPYHALERIGPRLFICHTFGYELVVDVAGELQHMTPLI